MVEDKILFTEKEWDAGAPEAARQMHEYLTQFCTAISKDHGNYGKVLGTGSYLYLADRTFILTNEHVASARSSTQRLLHQFQGQHDMRAIVGDHVELSLPLDIALLPVDQTLWNTEGHNSKAITPDKIALAHVPVESEMLTFAGYSGERSGFCFNTLFAKGTTSTSREIPLPDDDQFNKRYHFGLDYRPDLATNVIGTTGLPCPPGFSGSAVWNTRFVESKMSGKPWTPELAQVTGLVWGWASSTGCIVATRSEYLRSFLLTAQQNLNGAGFQS